MEAEKDATIKELAELIILIRKDLKMRAGEDGVINISNFIWQHIEALANKHLKG